MYGFNASSSKESVISDSTESDGAKTSQKKEVINSNICPFEIQWSIGINSEVPLINLTTENRAIIAYACSHIVIMYNYETKETFALQGHRNAIRTLSVSRDGKWLLSADFEEDSVVVIWDTESGTPISTLFNPHKDDGMTAARISPNAKYVVTVGNGKLQKVHFWQWTYGREEPDASIELPEISMDRIKEINFNEESPEQFILTTDCRVLFLIWTQSELKYFRPKIIGKTRRIGVFNCSCYVPKSQEILTATTNGYVIVWRNNIEKDYATSLMDDDNGTLKHVKSLQLQKHNITVILYYDGMIVTGNSVGRITFYDCHLRILYWCHNCGLDSIRSISFDLKSKLLPPGFVASESELKFGENEDEWCEGFEEEFNNDTEDLKYKQKVEHLKDLNSTKCYSSKLTINIEPSFKSYEKKERFNEEFLKSFSVPTDATLKHAPFKICNFFVCTSRGIIALIEISKLKCHFISEFSPASITSLDVHPESNYVVAGNAEGELRLYDYQERNLIVLRKTPHLPDFRPILDNQVTSGKIIYVTCPQNDESLTAITLLKYSPNCDMLVCGLENGAIWVLHPITLEPLDAIPYKHSLKSILKVTFTKSAEYMAYMDNAMVVGVFKRNDISSDEVNLWNFIGKYHSHCLPISDIIFGPPIPGHVVPRLFSVGEDKDFVEYDLENSGPYPEPGLKILQIDRIEYTATPLCLSWYPGTGVETFLIISNSEYKYRLLNDLTKTIRGTFLGPTFGAAVQHFEVLRKKEGKSNRYMIFVTQKEIGLQLFPLDGNPYKMVGMIAHPQKVIKTAVSCDGNILFTAGYHDPCILMWDIKYRSVDVMARLGGMGLSPFYCLVEGGRNGWLIKEMQDLFYYAQILHQGENTMAMRIVSDKVTTKQIPNLMRAVGYYPSNEELEIIMGEVSYRHYAETGQLVEEITFEDFVKLYINHRPVFGVSTRQMKEAFCAFLPLDQKDTENQENPTLTREQFMNILFGKGPEGFPEESNKLFGEPLTYQEAHMYMKLLMPPEDYDFTLDYEQKSYPIDFTFLPERISYKDFTTDIMGIELPEETRADNE